MCGKLRTPRRPPSIFGARRGEIQDDFDPVSISAPTSWCVRDRSLLCNRGDADFQIWPPLLHFRWIIKRDGQTVPLPVPRQWIIDFVH
jgi:hypothetical protein